MDDDREAAPDYDDERHSPDRLLYLTDGIFAISITLLALDVRLELPDDVKGHAAAASFYGMNSGTLYAKLGIFVVAFWITSRFWVTNHRQMRVLHHIDTGVIERMLLFLAGICSLPVATSVLFSFGDVPAAVTFASCLLAATALLSGRLWWYVSDPKRDLATVSPENRRRVMIRSLLVVVVYLLAIPATWLLPNPAVAPFVWVLMGVIDRVSDRVNARFSR